MTLVAAEFSFGGFSKVWNGAGDGTSHSSPSAPSHGCCGAFSPLPRIIGTTTQKKNNLRLGLILASIAVVIFIGFIVKSALLAG